MTNNKPLKQVSRRKFLVNTGWAAAGITLLSSCQSLLPAFPSTSSPELEDGLLWIQLMPSGEVQFLCPRMEMGQGAAVGLTQIVATELKVDQAHIQCQTPSTNDLPRFKLTVGSESIAVFHRPVAIMAARLREYLRREAALKADLHPSDLKHSNAGFISPDGSVISYESLVINTVPVILGDKDLETPAPALYFDTPTSDTSQIGKNWKHPDIQAIVCGKMTYSRDVKVPGMAFATVFHPPFFNAKLMDVNWGGAKDKPGIIDLVKDLENNLAAIVADNPFIASSLRNDVEVLWQSPDGIKNVTSNFDIQAHIETDDFEHELISTGNVDTPATDSRNTIESGYETPVYTHAGLEPRSAVASVSGTSAEIWCGSQDPFFVRDRVARLLDFDEDQVVVHPQRMGGAFGGRVFCRAAEEAAILSRKSGLPVRVQWSREDEFQNSYFQPPFSHHIKASVSHDGTIINWQHDFLSAPIITGQVPSNIAWAVDMFVADKGTSRGAISPYNITNHRIRYSDIRQDIPVGAWRGLGSAPNNFAIESAIDELAEISQKDPIQFRLQNLPAKNARLASVLREVSTLSNWDSRAPAENEGYGVACSIYKNETCVAIVAKIKIDHQTEDVTISDIWCAQDNGTTINPDLVENQVVGNIIWGCSITLKERINFEAGRSMQTNFDDYEILRHNECPNIHIKLLATKDTPPLPVGEAALAPVSASITNAVYAATKRRIRQLPFDYDVLSIDT